MAQEINKIHVYASDEEKAGLTTEEIKELILTRDVPKLLGEIEDCCSNAKPQIESLRQVLQVIQNP